MSLLLGISLMSNTESARFQLQTTHKQEVPAFVEQIKPKQIEKAVEERSMVKIAETVRTINRDWFINFYSLKKHANAICQKN